MPEEAETQGVVRQEDPDFNLSAPNTVSRATGKNEKGASRAGTSGCTGAALSL
jgi:hypothetical protein